MSSPSREYRRISKDDGCEISPSCLDCPLPVCQYELPFIRSLEKVTKDLLISETDSEKGLHFAAFKHGVTVRTVYRILERSRPDV